MAPTVDTAILEALGLEAASAAMTHHGGSGFSSTFKLTGTRSQDGGQPATFFVKTGSGPDAAVMFAGEHASLNAIATASAFTFCPRSHAHGALASSPDRFFLATDFLELSSGSSSSNTNTTGTGMSLAAKLAKLHTAPPAPPAPSIAGQTTTTTAQPMFGFPVPTCCGATVQDNTWTPSWPTFYANNRLRHIVRSSPDEELRALVHTTADRVVPRLLGEDHLQGVVPVLCHGDLWSGNYGRGRILGQGDEEVGVVVYDPSCVYGHSEYDLGIMRMFGGFGEGFWGEYHALVPKFEPVEEYEDRIALYELYHHLNHFVMFGGGYRSGAIAIMSRLIAKYG